MFWNLARPKWLSVAAGIRLQEFFLELFWPWRGGFNIVSYNASCGKVKILSLKLDISIFHNLSTRDWVIKNGTGQEVGYWLKNHNFYRIKLTFMQFYLLMSCSFYFDQVSWWLSKNWGFYQFHFLLLSLWLSNNNSLLF